MPRRDRQELVNALLKTGGILLPEQVVQEDAHGVHAHRFSPSQFLFDLFGIKRRLLPHLQLVDRRLRNIITSNQPGLLRVPSIRLLLRPTWRLRPHYIHGEAEGEEHCYHENGFESFHCVNSAGNYMLAIRTFTRGIIKRVNATWVCSHYSKNRTFERPADVHLEDQ